MGTFVIRRNDIQTIEQHAGSVFPEECCGILLGSAQNDDVQVKRVIQADNKSTEQATERYTIAPEALLEAQKQATAAEMEVVGYYHSHATGTAEPSEIDLKAALPNSTYLILGLLDGVVLERKCWRLTKSGTGFLEQGIRYPPEEEYED